MIQKQKFEANMNAIAQAFSPAFAKAIGVSGVQPVSERTIKIALAAGHESAQGVNLIKITVQENGQFRLRTYRYEEIEDVPGIAPDKVEAAITAIAGIAAK